jgi:hypothetical protein
VLWPTTKLNRQTRVAGARCAFRRRCWPHELRDCMRPARAARQRRDQARDRCDRACVGQCLAWCGTRGNIGNDADLRARRRSSTRTARPWRSFQVAIRVSASASNLSVNRTPSGGLSIGLGLPLRFIFRRLKPMAGSLSERFACQSLPGAPTGPCEWGTPWGGGSGCRKCRRPILFFRKKIFRARHSRQWATLIEAACRASGEIARKAAKDRWSKK